MLVRVRAPHNHPPSGFLLTDHFYCLLLSSLRVRMKKSLSTTSACFESLFLTTFLLVSVFFSSTAGLSNRVDRIATAPAPTSVRSAPTLFRTYALGSFQGQRTAGDTSKQNRVKHPLTDSGLVSARFASLNGTIGRRLVADNASVFNSSFHHSRTRGRAPPLSA